MNLVQQLVWVRSFWQVAEPMEQGRALCEAPRVVTAVPEGGKGGQAGVDGAG